MRFLDIHDPLSKALRADLDSRVIDTDVAGLMTANLWLWQLDVNDTILDPQAVLAALLEHSGLPYQALLAPHMVSRPWVRLDAAIAQREMLRLLTCGVSLEIPAFDEEPQAALEFTHRLVDWLGSPLTAFTNMEHRSDGSAADFSLFCVPHWVDEGLVLIGAGRVGLLWFMGTD